MANKKFTEQEMLETKDLILDKGKIEDWKTLYENVWKHDETARYMMWSASHTEEEGYEMTQNYIKMQEVNPTAYIVYEKEGRVPIGFAGMRETDKGIFEDSGIAVGVSYTGKGYGKQILSALLSQAFEELGAQKFIYSCWAENIPSNKLAESAGLKFSHSEEAIDRRSGKAITMNYYEK